MWLCLEHPSNMHLNEGNPGKTIRPSQYPPTTDKRHYSYRHKKRWYLCGPIQVLTNMTGNIETYQTSTGHSSNLHNMRFVAATAEQVYSKTIKKVTSGDTAPSPYVNGLNWGNTWKTRHLFLLLAACWQKHLAGLSRTCLNAERKPREG